MNEKLLYHLDKKIEELEKILNNEEYVIDTEYDFVDKKNINSKLEKIKNLVQENNIDVELILLNKDVGKPLYSILVNDLVSKSKKQQRINWIVRFMYFSLILIFIVLIGYFFVNPPTEDTMDESITQESRFAGVEADEIGKLMIKRLSEDEENVYKLESFLQEKIQQKNSD
ncbi:hypothetical protein [Candidatus Absconditicoccus praedator]|uniref:hypothetical protein n=1 Tax=Candidatus Absconditicoccus praedator TaxID=2735562 RepID=UPI001E2A271D|nr:hypothetical protein [Candidatus Absconditicoccus praedator]UFX83334.1 hypothetical protein HLG78_04365 [Candidatus Absconditicoccus praedator]